MYMKLIKSTKCVGCERVRPLELRTEALSDFLTPLDHENTSIVGVDDDMAGLEVPIRAPRTHKCSSWCRIIFREN